MNSITLSINLQYDYNSNDDDQSTKGDHLFNRKEGKEVADMIQSVVDQLKYTDKAEVYRVEDMITGNLPGNIRSNEKVKDWLVGALVPENNASIYAKSLDLVFENSESGGYCETFQLSRFPRATSSDLDIILDYARKSGLVFSYATENPDAISRYDENVDYPDLNDLSLLYSDPSKNKDRQGWYKEVDSYDYAERLIHCIDEETYEYGSIGESVVDRYIESTNGIEALAIFNSPTREHDGGVYIWYGVDTVSDLLVGFMIECVNT